MEWKEILSHVDHTLLKPEATWEQVRKILEEAMEYGCASACIPAAYGKQEIGTELAPLSYGLAQCLYGRIGLYAPEFSIFTTGQSLDDLFINTVFLHASAAESYHYLFPGRNLRSYFLYHPFSEDELCRILKNKIIHSRIFISLYFQHLQMYSFMLHGRSCPATKNMHKRNRIAHVSCIRTTACRTTACNSR